METALLSIKDIRRRIPTEAYRKSALVAVVIFLVQVVLYGSVFTLTAWLDNWMLKVLAALALGVLTSPLFIIGHDACHECFSGSRLLDHVIGRLALLPSLHPFTCWDLGHNRIHHRWTNFKRRDYAWTPLSKAEYDALPAWRRLAERVCLSSWGLGLHYIFMVWIPHMIFPSRQERALMRPWPQRLDRLLVLVYGVGSLALFWNLSRTFHPTAGMARLAIETAIFGLLLPQMMWNWVLGLISFLQHTHETSAWFDQDLDWKFAAAQLGQTVHLELPWLLRMFFHNVTEHTVHHVDPRISLYQLRRAQSFLAAAFGDKIISYPFSIAAFLRTVRTCKLYDYRRGCWTDFDGKPTTTPKVQPHPEVNDSQAASPSVANRREP